MVAVLLQEKGVFSPLDVLTNLIYHSVPEGTMPDKINGAQRGLDNKEEFLDYIELMCFKSIKVEDRKDGLVPVRKYCHDNTLGAKEIYALGKLLSSPEILKDTTLEETHDLHARLLALAEGTPGQYEKIAAQASLFSITYAEIENGAQSNAADNARDLWNKWHDTFHGGRNDALVQVKDAFEKKLAPYVSQN